jgi:hypothetical protein
MSNLAATDNPLSNSTVDQLEIEGYPLVICYSLLLKMAIEIVDLPNLPMKNDDFPVRHVKP